MDRLGVTTSAYDSIRRSALEEIEREELDPARDHDRIAALVAAAVDEYQSSAHGGGSAPALRDPSGMVDRVVTSITAYGPLTQLLTAPDIEEIFIEGDRVSYVDGRGRLRAVAVPVGDTEARHVVARLLAATERRLDVASPIVQARVLGGTARLTAVIPPVSDRLSATIRRYALRRDSLDHLVELGSLSAPVARFLNAAMQVGSSLVVSGPPGAGKTSLLAALLAAVPRDHCVRCVEEVRELNVSLGAHSSYYEARPPGLDGGSAVTVRDLVKLVLAMRPDRIVVGEVRGPEAFELTRAANAGCGFCCTVHANTARDALDALVNAALMAGENVTADVVRSVFASSIDLVVHLDRVPGSARRELVEVLAVRPSVGTGFTTEPVFRREPGGRLRWSGALPAPELVRRIEAAAATNVRDICGSAA